MMNAYYLVQLNGWHDLVNRYTPTVMADVWDKLVSKVGNISLVTTGDFSLLLSDAKSNALVFRENAVSGAKRNSDFVSGGLVEFFREFLGLQSFLKVEVDVWRQTLEKQPDILKLEAQFKQGKKLHCAIYNDDDGANSLAAILKDQNIQSYLQPIVLLKNKKVLGYEMLTRGPDDSPLFRADKLFGEAARQGLSEDLETLALSKAVSLLPKLPKHQFLTANISPFLLKNRDLYRALVNHDSQDRLKLELTEHLPVDDWDALRDDMAMYQQSGSEFWLDDTGCGYFGLETIEKVRPRVVKLCITLVSRIDENPQLIEQLKGVVAQVHAMGGKVLGEGVETREQEKILKQIGVDLAQGYYYARPAPSHMVLA